MDENRKRKLPEEFERVSPPGKKRRIVPGTSRDRIPNYVMASISSAADLDKLLACYGERLHITVNEDITPLDALNVLREEKFIHVSFSNPGLLALKVSEIRLGQSGSVPNNVRQPHVSETGVPGTSRSTHHSREKISMRFVFISTVTDLEDKLSTFGRQIKVQIKQDITPSEALHILCEPKYKDLFITNRSVLVQRLGRLRLTLSGSNGAVSDADHGNRTGTTISSTKTSAETWTDGSGLKPSRSARKSSRPSEEVVQLTFWFINSLAELDNLLATAPSGRHVRVTIQEEITPDDAFYIMNSGKYRHVDFTNLGILSRKLIGLRLEDVGLEDTFGRVSISNPESENVSGTGSEPLRGRGRDRPGAGAGSSTPMLEVPHYNVSVIRSNAEIDIALEDFGRGVRITISDDITATDALQILCESKYADIVFTNYDILLLKLIGLRYKVTGANSVNIFSDQ